MGDIKKPKEEVNEKEANLETLLKELKSELAKQKKEQVKVEEPKKVDKPETDFNGMTPKEFAAHIRSETIAEMQEGMKPFLQQVMALTYTTEKGRIAGGDKLFEKYEKDVQELITQHPSMSVDDAFTLAKAKRPQTIESIPPKRENIMKSLFAVESKVEDKNKAQLTASDEAWAEVMGEATEIA
jgi:hypothetical protein